MKKAISVILVLSFILSFFCACGEKNEERPENSGVGRYVETREELDGSSTLYFNCSQLLSDGSAEMVFSEFDHEEEKTVYHRYIVDKDMNKREIDAALTDDIKKIEADALAVCEKEEISPLGGNDMMFIAPDGSLYYELFLYRCLIDENGKSDDKTDYRRFLFKRDMEGNCMELQADPNLGSLFGILPDGDLVFCNADAATANPVSICDSKTLEVKTSATYSPADDGKGIAFDSENMYVANNGTVTVYSLKDFTIKEKIKIFDPQDFEYINMSLNVNPYTEELFITCSLGIYRIAKNSTIVEQIMAGEDYSFGIPELALFPVLLSDNRFLIYAMPNGGTAWISTFVFDKNISTFRSKTLKIFTMYKSETLLKAIHVFEEQNRDTKVELTIGSDSMDTMTAEDVIRNLNTQLLAGAGPDVIILDHLPAQSYIDKGILCDLSNSIDTSELYGNILEAFRKDGKLYAVPAKFTFPMVYCTEEYISKTDGFSTIAETVTKNTKSYTSSPEDDKVYVNTTVDSAFDILYHTSKIGCGKTAGERLDETALREMLEAVVKISGRGAVYDSGSYFINKDLIGSGIPNGGIKTNSWIYLQNGENLYPEYRITVEGNILLADYSSIKGDDAEKKIISFKMNDGTFENRTLYRFKTDFGQVKNTFSPCISAAINKSGKNQKDAEKFIQTLVSQEVLSNLSYNANDGVPVNVNSVSASMKADRRNAIDYSEQYSQYLPIPMDKMIRSLDTPCYRDGTEQLIFDEVVEIFTNGRSIDDTVRIIKEKMKLKLSEK